jgi:hypothetical protein
MDALRDRFGNHTDAIFKRHAMKSNRLLVARGFAELAPPLYIRSGTSQPSGSREELGRLSRRCGMEEGESPIRDAGVPLVDHIDNYFMDASGFPALK